jgi:uncharacterized protein YebE (UPF0316 family)
LVPTPVHIVTSVPAFAIGVGLTVIITASVDEQLPVVAVTVYVVVDEGVAVGLAMFAALNPVAGNHE